MRGRAFRLCLILTRSLCRHPPLEVLQRALAGGVDLVQIREKEASVAEIAAWTSAVQPICRQAGVPVIINDSVEIARALGAEGVHLGQDDLDPAQARAILGPQALIGWSTHDEEQVEAAIRMRNEGTVDLVGFGPAFATATKGYAEGLGAARVLAAAGRARTAGLPLLAIGGITVENRATLGQDLGIAVCGALCAAADPCASARALLA